MKYVLIDSNIILDIVLNREAKERSAEAIAKVLKAHKHCIISASEITDIYYVLKKLQSDDFARDAIGLILSIAQVANVQESDIRTALNLNMKDFEDAVLAAVAQRHNAEYIITNNIKDFVNSPVKAVRPEKYQ